MCNSPLVAHHFQVDQTIAVDGGRKGVRGGGCGRPVGRSVILNYQVCRDKTSSGCYIPTHCPRLPANVTATLSPPADRMDGPPMCGGHGGVCVWRRRDGQTRVWAGASPSSPRSLVSHHAATPTQWQLTGAGARTDGRAAQCTAALAGRRRSTAHEDDAAAVLRTVSRCN